MIFWIYAAVLLLATLAFLLPPLLRKPTDILDDRRDQNISITKHQLAELEDDYKAGGLEEETYLQAKAELEDALYSDLEGQEHQQSSLTKNKRMTASKIPLIFVALFIPVLATGMYLKIGNPQGLTESSVDLSKPVAQNEKKPAMSFDKMLVKLETRLKAEPDYLKGWQMLGRSYMVVNRPADAVKAYEKAIALQPNDATTLLQMADALGTSTDGDLKGRPEKLILQALKYEPENVMGLWLAGMAAKQRGASEEAISYWNKVLPKLESKDRKEVEQLIAEAGGVVEAGGSAKAGQEPAKAAASNVAATTPPKNQQAGSASQIIVKIDLAEALKAKTNPDQTLFIYAKALTGPPMPLAAIRKQVKDLPIEVVLNDSMAMMPQLKISGFKEVKVGARISVSGTPTKSSGDLFTEQSPVKLGETVSLVINEVAE